MNKKGILWLILILLIAIVIVFATVHSTNKGASSGITTAPPSNASSSIQPVTRPNIWGEYHVSLPDALILVDAQGRRTGKDPATGIAYHEIPGTSYEEVGSGSTNGAGELLTSNLPSGDYTLYVLGAKTGNYWLDLSHYGQQDQSFRGTIQAGSMISYVQHYDTANLASSTFSDEATVSSTASITGMPPNNLPPPGVK